MGGLNAAIQLQYAGIPFVVLEKNAGVGGTWFENRYPGCRVDTPSLSYTNLFGLDYEFPYAFCPQSVNEQYFNWVADHFDIRRSIEFNTEVKSVVWDEEAKSWEIRRSSRVAPASGRSTPSSPLWGSSRTRIFPTSPGWRTLQARRSTPRGGHPMWM